MEIKVDELGRIVIPKNIRDSLKIKKLDSVNLSTAGDKLIIVKPKESEKIDFLSQKIVISINDRYKYDCVLTNREKIIFATKKYKYLINKNISKYLNDLLEDNNTYMQRVFSLEICDNEVIKGHLYCFAVKENYCNKGLLIIDYTNKDYDDNFFKFINDIVN